MPLPNYEDLGFSQWLDRSIVNTETQSKPSFSSEINFDNVQTSGGLGSVIQVGNINIDGVNGRIEIIEDGVPIILIGKDYE